MLIDRNVKIIYNRDNIFYSLFIFNFFFLEFYEIFQIFFLYKFTLIMNNIFNFSQLKLTI